MQKKGGLVVPLDPFLAIIKSVTKTTWMCRGREFLHLQTALTDKQLVRVPEGKREIILGV